MVKEDKITIIIKTLNEESNVERAIVSALESLKNYSGEVIVADSLSTDNTIELAKKYPIKIVQLTSVQDRSCGVGPQLGFQYAMGEFIYILDGDMELEPLFFSKAINILKKEKNLAGIAGTVTEMRTDNLIFKNRKDRNDKPIGYVDKLEMGGLYKRQAIIDVGYFSNRNLHAYEEAELGYRLIRNKWRLKRINQLAVKHYGFATTSYRVFKHRWRSKYAYGAGEFLRTSFGKSHFLKVILLLKIYVVLILWWLFGLVSIFYVASNTLYIRIFLIVSLSFVLVFVFKKKSMYKAFFSILSWHFTSFGLICGLFSKQIDPMAKIEYKVIKQ